MFKRTLLLAGFLAAVPLAFGPDDILGPAELRAQQMGNEPWSYSRNSRGFWANYQAVRRSQQQGGGGGGPGWGGSGAEINYFYSSSTAIANQSNITQTLGDGATGVIDSTLGQSSTGDQTADTTAEHTFTTDNSVSVSGPAE